jgi:hypothetical protein
MVKPDKRTGRVCPETKKTGRPRIIPKLWNEKKKKEILASYEEGGSQINAMLILGIKRDVFYDTLATKADCLTPEERDFCDTIAQGELLSQCWWEKKGRLGTIGEINNFRDSSWRYTMMNRFRRGGFNGSWAEKQDSFNVSDDNDKVDFSIILNKE